jgi:hypothetical protein
MQLGDRQLVIELVNPVHVVALVPSHWAAEHTPASPPGHAGRVPWGLPTICVHVPSDPGASQAVHWPVQALLQQ